MGSDSILKYIFTVVGFGMLVGAFFLFTNTQSFLKSSLTADGTVIELKRSRVRNSSTHKKYTYRPVVEFKTIDGLSIKFTSPTGSSPASYSKGEAVEVLYQKSSPEKAKINSFFSLWGGTIIVGFLGLVFFLIGILIIFLGSMKSKKNKYLRENGIPIKAKFQNVKLNRSLRVNGKNPYQISVQWQNPTTSQLHIFDSENIWFDPTDYISSDDLTVLIERDNPKKYYVDISFLPKVAS